MWTYYCPHCGKPSEHKEGTWPVVEVECPHCKNKFYTSIDNTFDWSQEWNEDFDKGEEDGN